MKQLLPKIQLLESITPTPTYKRICRIIRLAGDEMNPVSFSYTLLFLFFSPRTYFPASSFLSHSALITLPLSRCTFAQFFPFHLLTGSSIGPGINLITGFIIDITFAHLQLFAIKITLYYSFAMIKVQFNLSSSHLTNYLQLLPLVRGVRMHMLMQVRVMRVTWRKMEQIFPSMQLKATIVNLLMCVLMFSE